VNNQPGADYVVDHFQKYIHPGAMPLIHNVSESNAQALDQVLTDLENKGYRFGDAAEIGEKKKEKETKTK
jgi:peptidoglycan-N-acetylmuramic acid deacetylase